MPEGAWVHYGLTSSDVVDTALCYSLTAAMDIVVDEVRDLRDALTRRAEKSVDTPIVGRTHGMHAEPTTYGAKFALFALQVNRDLERAERARTGIAVGKLSGAVGTFSNIDPKVEEFVCERLGLAPVPATQVIARDRHAEVLYACAAIGTSIEQFSLEVRHLARSEVGEVEEPFTEGQKGSSAMPHKRNPVVAERLSGLSRVLRGYLQAGLEDVALWHERDISHSSVERVVMPDALMLTVYMLRKATWLADGLVLHEDRALENLNEGSLGLVFSQSVLLALIESGVRRDDAYRVVQRASRRAIDERRNFRDVVESDDEVTLSNEAIAYAFDIDRLLMHRRRVLDALTWRA
jgi:adenylosuccinate lyase